MNTVEGKPCVVLLLRLSKSIALRGASFAGGIQSFALEKGDGAPVVCLHGVPTSSFVYRKLVPELGKNGLRGIAFDYPGMGFSGRPEQFDYTWHGLAQ